MADNSKGVAADSESGKDGDDSKRQAEKRKSTESVDAAGDSSTVKKFSMSVASKPAPSLNTKISFNLASSGTPKPKVVPSTGPSVKAPVAPIKMSLNSTQKLKEAPPVVQKSAAAAKVFEESDDSEEEEMPPEAKMRMKNIGRDTPTASGPNSYGKGKQGFIDRNKIIEKQIQKEMEKVSGDNE